MFQGQQYCHFYIQTKLNIDTHMQMRKHARDRHQVLPQMCLNTKGHHKWQRQGCLDSGYPLMSRWEESPQVHKLPHSESLPLLSGNKLSALLWNYSSLVSANAEIKVTDMCEDSSVLHTHTHTGEVNFECIWHEAMGYRLSVTPL